MTKELIVDNFAGGGGASTGIELALGRPIDIAINHDPMAIAMHKANHPHTKHYEESVWDVDPVEICNGNPVGLMWMSPDCFPKGTLVLTLDGYKPIENIVVGEYVLTHKQRWKKVVETSNTMKPLMTIKGYGHFGLRVSKEHPFYIKSRKNVWNNDIRQYRAFYSNPEWKTASSLSEKDYWGIPTKIPSLPIPEMKQYKNGTCFSINEKLLWLAGRYVGDGWTRLTDTRAELVIYCRKHEAEELYPKLNMWPKSEKKASKEQLSWYKREQRTSVQYITNSRALVEWLRENFGHLAHNKSIPSWLYGANNNLKQAFLEGYVSADGHRRIVNHISELTQIDTVSRKLAFSIKQLISTMGYTGTVYHRSKNSDIIEKRHVNARPSYSVRWRTEIISSHAQTFEEEGILWSAIKQVDSIDSNLNKVYNIGVEEDESYIVEGVIVHNCKHFSKAKGGAPVKKNIRGLAWIALKWAGLKRPRVIILENVEEFQTWGPIRKGKPIKAKAGKTFEKWKAQLKSLGYVIEHRELVAADYGAPTTRKRFFLIARCDGKPIVWPERTHAPKDSEEVKNGKCLPWHSAAEIIAWDLPCPSIFDSKKDIKEKYGVQAVRPLASNTHKRIARGLDKFVLKSANPFIINCKFNNAPEDIKNSLTTLTTVGSHLLCAPSLIQYHQEQSEYARGQILENPLMTVDTANRYGYMATSLIKYYGQGDAQSLHDPLHTITVKDREGTSIAFLSKYFSGGYKGSGADIESPLPTITTVDHNVLAAVHIAEFKGQDKGQSIQAPLRTITTSAGEFGEVKTTLTKIVEGVSLYYWPEIRSILNTYCGYTMKDDEILLLEINGEQYFISDIGLRMLSPQELYRAQGFPNDYIIDRDYTGKNYGKTHQVARCGNAVPPPFAYALVKANFPEYARDGIETMEDLRKAIAA